MSPGVTHGHITDALLALHRAEDARPSLIAALESLVSAHAEHARLLAEKAELRAELDRERSARQADASVFAQEKNQLRADNASLQKEVEKAPLLRREAIRIASRAQADAARAEEYKQTWLTICDEARRTNGAREVRRDLEQACLVLADVQARARALTENVEVLQSGCCDTVRAVSTIRAALAGPSSECGIAGKRGN